MYHTIKEFEEAWGQDSTLTAKTLHALSDESLKQEVTAGHRNLGRIAWHIVMTIPEMAQEMGLDMGDFDPKAPVPATAKEIAEEYLKHAKTLIDRVKMDWDDDVLGTEVDMYGQKWRRDFGLQALIQHQIHHRGQMSILMRQAGIRVPSLYGPAKEDWASMDVEPPEV